MIHAQAKAKAAVERLMKERGCLVVGFPPENGQPVIVPPGRMTNNFAGQEIPGKLLEIASTATFSDWEAQAKHLGLPQPHQPDKDNRFYFARLVKAPAVKA